MKDNIFCHIITDIHHESSNNMTHLTHSRANGFTGEREVGRGKSWAVPGGVWDSFTFFSNNYDNFY